MAATAGSAVKQLHRAEPPLCDASRFQLTQFGSPWLALYDIVYWRRVMMRSSLGSASVGVPRSVLCPTRTLASPIGASYVVMVVDAFVADSFLSVAVIVAEPTAFAVITPVVAFTATMFASDVDHVT